MSLINDMLQDLEQRQALAGVREDRVLGDLHAAREGVFPDIPSRTLYQAFLLLAAMVVFCLGYTFYTSKSVPIPIPVNSSNMAMPPASRSETAKPTVVAPVPVNEAPKPAAAAQVPMNEAPKPAAAAPVPENEASNSAATAQAPVSEVRSSVAAITPRATSFKTNTSTNEKTLPRETASTGNAVGTEPAAAIAESPTAAPAGTGNRLLHIGLTDLAEGSVVLVNTSSNPEYDLFLLKKPDRLLVEIKDLEMPAKIVGASYRSNVVARLRHGMRGDTSLLIFDLKGPVAIDSSDVREMPGGGYTLDIELLDASKRVDTAAVGGAQDKSAPATAGTGIHPPDTDNTGHRTFQKNVAGTGDTHLLENAVHAYHNGEVAHATDMLRRILTRDPQQLRARTTLATILMQEQDRIGAMRVLSEGLRLSSGNAELIKLYAKLLFEEGRLDQAVAWLRQAQPKITEDPDYYALLAAVLQRRKDYADAGELYRKLVAIRPDNGVWWMGLGISLEGMGRSAEALKAYGNARKDSSLAQDLTRYIDARIKTLGG